MSKEHAWNTILALAAIRWSDDNLERPPGLVAGAVFVAGDHPEAVHRRLLNERPELVFDFSKQLLETREPTFDVVADEHLCVGV